MFPTTWYQIQQRKSKRPREVPNEVPVTVRDGILTMKLESYIDVTLKNSLDRFVGLHAELSRHHELIEFLIFLFISPFFFFSFLSFFLLS